MKYLSSMALAAGFASSRRPHYVRSELLSAEPKRSLRNNAIDRNLQAPSEITNSVTEGPITLQQLELIQSIIQRLSQVDLPDGVDLTQVNVAVIITEVLQELGIDAAVSDGDLSEVEMELIVQEIIAKAAEELGVDIVTDTTTAATSVATTTTAVAVESCSVCGEGMKVGNPLAIFSFPGQPEVACGALEIAGANGVIQSDQCALLPSLITDVCECIPTDSVVTTTVAPPATTTTPTGPSCACSPLSYTFTVNLSQNCDTDTFIDNPGIGDTVCLVIPPSINDDGVEVDTVFDVQFLEVDTSGNLIVINQDDTYNNVSLSTGDTLTFDSVSAKLNPDEPLSSQLNYVPGGVLMSLRAKSEGSETIVTNRVSWMYTNSCESVPTSVGDAIGWITLSDQTEASQAFCPVAASATPTLSPTKTVTVTPTTSPVAATDPPTSSPTKSPTLAPIASTDPPSPSPSKAPTPSPVASCVCSPLSYTFTINLNQNCDTDTFIDNPGIGDTVCLVINDDDVDFDTLKVIDVQFLQVDTSGNLIVINQDDTYNNVSLSTGDTITFDSVSAKLNPDEPLSSQLNYVPGGVLMSLRAKSEGSETIVTNRVSWMYTNSCESVPTSVGDAIGWITLSDQTEASQAFCPVAASATPTLSPTKTATVTPTASPVNTIVTDPPTSSPTKSPTLAPIASTDPPSSSPSKAPTPSPVAATDSPTSSPTKNPTLSPIASTDPPTNSPTKNPSPSPIASTDQPTSSPSTAPTPAPVAATDSPTSSPTKGVPVQDPPTSSPTKSPTLSPVPDPTKEPTLAPITPTPTKAKVPTTTPTSSPTTFGKAAKSFAKATKSDPLAKTIKEGTKSSKADTDTLAKTTKQGGDASMPSFAKTPKSSKSAASYFISKSNKSQKENSPSSKAEKQSTSADAKAYKISSKATASLSMMI